MEIKNAPILVVGAAGMLGHDVVSVLQRRSASLSLAGLETKPVHGLPVHSLDITDVNAVDAVLGSSRARCVINCAAYTAVDKAEEERDLAFAVNATGVGLLAAAAHRADALFVQISTDYVFGGRPGTRPWKEDDDCSPCGVYGHSKREGELAALAAHPRGTLILRTSWLHGLHGPNFVHTILRVAKERDELRVVSDQIGSPTWSSWLAEVIGNLIARDVRGVVHASSHGNISWCDFAAEIVRLAGLSTRVLPQSTADAGRPAPRPPYSTLDLGRLEALLGESAPDWRQGLREHLALLGESRS